MAGKPTQSTRGVVWCPYDDRLFLASGAGLHLYQVAQPAKDLNLADVNDVLGGRIEKAFLSFRRA